MASNRQLYVEIIGDDRSLQRAYKRSAEGTARLNHEVGRVTRGVAAGSGVFRTLGRSLAFASGGFIAAAGAADLIRGSIQQASAAAATQKQLAAQFKASGQNLSLYRDQIDQATNAVSRLAGFEDDQLTQAFTTAFRGSQSVTTSLKIQAIAADVARGRHIDLQTAALALTKAYGGQVTALRRLGVLVPAQLKGVEALTFVQQKFAGQAAAGTTAQERFSAAFANFEEHVGTALLPTFNKLLNTATKWLGDTRNQKKVQDDLNTILGTTVTVMSDLAGGVDFVRRNWKKLNDEAGRFGLNQGLLDMPILPGGKLTLRQAFNKIPGHDQGLLEILGVHTAPGARAIGGNIEQPGRSPGGAGAFQATVGAAIQTTRRRLGLHAQWVRSQTELAKAETTSGDADNRRVLVQQKKIIAAALSATTNLKKRKVLYQELGQIQDAILKIDQQAADKVAAAKKKQHDKELAQQKKIREAIQAQSDKVNSEFKKMLDAQKAAAAKLKARLKAATDAVRQQIGDLFTGPVLNPTDAASKGILGVTGGGGPTIGTLTRDVVAQTAGFITRNADLARLARAGAPGALLKQLRDSGDSALIHTLATGSKAAQSRLFKAVSAQEKVIQQIAHADIQARTVVVHSGNVRHTSVTPQSQRRGRGAGVVQGGFLRGD